MSALSLFQQVRSCQDCLFSWDGYSSGFSRGHTVLAKGELVLFAPDDLIYSIPQNDSIDIEGQLLQLGWVDLDSCPKCGSRRLFPAQYSQESRVDVPCLWVTSTDLGKDGNAWRLTDAALLRFA